MYKARTKRPFIPQHISGVRQEGGEVVSDESAVAPPPGAGGDPMEQLVMTAQSAVENNDCEAAMQVSQMILQMAQGGAPEEGAAPPPEAGMEPGMGMGGEMYKKGGKMPEFLKKKKKGMEDEEDKKKMGGKMKKMTDKKAYGGKMKGKGKGKKITIKMEKTK